MGYCDWLKVPKFGLFSTDNCQLLNYFQYLKKISQLCYSFALSNKILSILLHCHGKEILAFEIFYVFVTQRDFGFAMCTPDSGFWYRSRILIPMRHPDAGSWSWSQFYIRSRILIMQNHDTDRYLIMMSVSGVQCCVINGLLWLVETTKILIVFNR